MIANAYEFQNQLPINFNVEEIQWKQATAVWEGWCIFPKTGYANSPAAINRKCFDLVKWNESFARSDGCRS